MASMDQLLQSKKAEKVAAAAAGATAGATLTAIPLDALDPNPHQPRKHFDEAELNGLAQSIGKRGLLQAITVTPNPEQPGRYYIIAGERRTRAHRLLRDQAPNDADRARWNTINAMVKTVATSADQAVDALVENLERANLTALEEADAVAAFAERESLPAEKVANELAMKLERVKRLLQLHDAPEVLRRAMTKGLMVEVEPPSGEGERARREHRTVSDLTAAIEFVRLYNHYKRTKPKKADVFLERDLERALIAEWSVRRIAEYRAQVMDGKVKPGAGPAEGEGALGAGPKARPVTVVVDDGKVLAVKYAGLDKLTEPEARATARQQLSAAAEQLQALANRLAESA